MDGKEESRHLRLGAQEKAQQAGGTCRYCTSEIGRGGTYLESQHNKSDEEDKGDFVVSGRRASEMSLRIYIF